MIFDKNDFGSKQTSHLKFRDDFEINIEINKANILFQTRTPSIIKKALYTYNVSL